MMLEGDATHSNVTNNLRAAKLTSFFFLVKLNPVLEKELSESCLKRNTLTLCRSFKAEKLKRKSGSQRHLEQNQG